MTDRPFESKIQDLVYNVDVGVGVRIIKTGLYLLFILSVMLVYTATQFRGLKDAGAMEYAQLGRNMLYNKALVTQCIRPVSMWYLIEYSPDHNPQINRHPDVLHTPLYPAVLATGFRLFGVSTQTPSGQDTAPEKWVIVPVGHFFTLLCGLFVFLLARLLFDDRLPLYATTLFFLSNVVWANAISGLPTSMLMFFCLAAFYFLAIAAGLHREKDRRWPLAFAASVLLTVAGLYTRYAFFLLLPGLVLFTGLSFKRTGWRWAIMFLVICLLGITPWLVRNVMVTGGLFGLAPYTALRNTGLFPEQMFDHSLIPTMTFGGIVAALKTKWMNTFYEFFQNGFTSVGDGFLICLFWVSFLYPFVRRRVHILRWSIGLSMLLVLLISGFFGEQTFHLIEIFWPFILLYGISYFQVLIDRINFSATIFRTMSKWIFGAVCALPLLLIILPPRAGIPYPPYYAPFINHVCTLLDRNELLCTDMPWATAWYGDQSSILIPGTIDEFYEINDYTKRISGLYITQLTRDQPWISKLATGEFQTWFPVLQGRIPAEFPLTQGFPIREQDQMFLTDRPRWTE